tara:strand:+ start:427 stop:585 length:159 start_codon:yes stop_codon:yes gene_type:complete
MITLVYARKEVERLVGCGSGYVAVEVPFNPRRKNVLEQAMMRHVPWVRVMLY